MTPPRRNRLGLGAWWLFAVVLAAGLGTVVLAGRPMVGGSLMGAAFLMGALLRLTLPADRAGGMAVRSKAVDVLIMLALGALVLVAFGVTDLRPR